METRNKMREHEVTAFSAALKTFIALKPYLGVERKKKPQFQGWQSLFLKKFFCGEKMPSKDPNFEPSPKMLE